MVARSVRITFLLFGLFLIIEGILSLIAFSDQNMIFSFGRGIRILIGYFLFFISLGYFRQYIEIKI